MRSAIHDAQGATPGWGERASDSSAVAYRLTDEAVAQLPGVDIGSLAKEQPGRAR